MIILFKDSFLPTLSVDEINEFVSSNAQQMVDDLKEREVKLEATNRKMNQRVLELEHGMGQSVPRIPGSREELELKLAEANKKVSIKILRRITNLVYQLIVHHLIINVINSL